jgi:hypothetical protein
MAHRHGARKNLVDRTEAVLDETHDLVEDQPDRLPGGEDDDLTDSVRGLKRAVAHVAARLDRLLIERLVEDVEELKRTVAELADKVGRLQRDTKAQEVVKAAAEPTPAKRPPAKGPS